MKLQKHEWKMYQQFQKREEYYPIPGITKMTSHPWENEAKQKNVEGKHTQEILDARESSREEKMARKTSKHESMVECPMFLGFFFPKESKRISQKLMASPIRIWVVIPFPSHAIINPTNF